MIVNLLLAMSLAMTAASWAFTVRAAEVCLETLAGVCMHWGPAQQRSPAEPSRDDFSIFRDCPVCPAMVVLPAGRFMMGSPDGETGRKDPEGPQIEVRIQRFALARSEVTFDEWAACVDGGGCQANTYPDDFGMGRGSRPVVDVTWNDAISYISWLNSKVRGSPYRLPSEAEFEYAARAGSREVYPWGKSLSALCTFANVLDRSAALKFPESKVEECDDGHPNTSPVGSFRANRFGLFDMIGNVWEWTQDCSHDSYSGRPRDGSAWEESSKGNCDYRIVRGGSYISISRDLRSATRHRGEPDGRWHSLGFRPAKTLAR